MVLGSNDYGDAVVKEVSNLFGAGAGFVADRAADFIKSPGVPSVIPNLGVGVARQVCRRYADNPAGVSGSRAAGYERVCRPYLDDIGYGKGPGISLPFRGGQCGLGVRYVVYWDSNSVTTTGETQEPPVRRIYIGGGSGVPGPIEGLRVTGSPGAMAVVLTFGGGNEVQIISSSAPQGAFRNAKIVDLVRTDGLPDNCGNPPPIRRPPVPPPEPGPTREPFNPNVDIDVDIDVTIGPNGVINFNFGTGPITINPFNEGDSSSGAIAPGDVGDPGTPVDIGDGAAGAGGDGAAEGEAPPGTVLTGVRMVLLQSPPSPTQYKEGVFRGSAYIRMGTSKGLDLDYAGQMLSNGQFVFAEKDFLTHWRVEVNRGYKWQVIPFFRDV